MITKEFQQDINSAPVGRSERVIYLRADRAMRAEDCLGCMVWCGVVWVALNIFAGPARRDGVGSRNAWDESDGCRTWMVLHHHSSIAFVHNNLQPSYMETALGWHRRLLRKSMHVKAEDVVGGQPPR